MRSWRFSCRVGPETCTAEGLKSFVPIYSARRVNQMLTRAIVKMEKFQMLPRISDPKIHGCEIIRVCDTGPLMAEQQPSERFQVKRWYSALREILEDARPDIVVHIHETTTRKSRSARSSPVCLERGCHVYLEKPFTLNAERRSNWWTSRQ